MAPTDIALPLAARKQLYNPAEPSQSILNSSSDALFPTSTGDASSGNSAIHSQGTSDISTEDASASSGGGGSISIMLKKGNKVQVKDLNVPITDEMAENIKQQKIVRYTLK